LAIINSSTFAYYLGETFILTDSWAFYTFTFTSPVTANTLFNFDLGDEIGTFCFDDFSFAQSSLLPVELVDIRAEKTEHQTIEITWVSASEENLSHFEIQKRTDFKDWEIIGKVNAFGEPHRYFFEDTNPAFGKNYYRLNSIDKDGKMEISGIITIFYDEFDQVEVFPNPTYNKLIISNLNYESAEVYFLNGQLVKEVILPNEEGFIELDVADLKPGNYFLKLEGARAVDFSSFVKMD